MAPLGNTTVPIIALTREVPGLEAALPPTEEARVVVSREALDRAGLLRFIAGASAVVTMFLDRVDEEFLRAAGPGLKVVCNFAVGVDNIDIAACLKAGVTVTNTPDAVTEGTANLTMGLLLAVARRIVEGDAFARSGAWAREGNGFPSGWMGMDLAGRTLHIVGAGRIGRAVVLRAQAFGMRTIYTARRVHAEFEHAPLAAERVGLDEGLARADVVSIHTPLTPETRHLMDARRIGLMKPTAILLNTSRGPTVDEGALAAALAQGKIFGAGLDVFEDEPRVHEGLKGLRTVVMTPHIGSAERRWREEMTRMVMANARAVLAGRGAINPV
ncbi:MAG: 2-hydroxyacid dehydrogenase [Phycisphaerales bacterium]